MRGSLQIGLRAGEKIYINGAVLSVDRKVRIELLNEATFLLGSHVMQLEAAVTPLRQIYFLVQSLLMDPSVANALKPSIRAAIAAASVADAGGPVAQGLATTADLIAKGSHFETLKHIRTLIALDEGRSSGGQAGPADHKEVA